MAVGQPLISIGAQANDVIGNEVVTRHLIVTFPAPGQVDPIAKAGSDNIAFDLVMRAHNRHTVPFVADEQLARGICANVVAPYNVKG